MEDRRRTGDTPTSKTKSERIDLGLAVLSAWNSGKDRIPMSIQDIAAWCGCTDSAIEWIQRGALKKLRSKIDRDPEIKAIFELAFDMGFTNAIEQICHKEESQLSRAA